MKKDYSIEFEDFSVSMPNNDKEHLKQSNGDLYSFSRKINGKIIVRMLLILGQFIEENVMQVRFSIIIPVYNAEKYIEECVKSITQQSYKNFEVILVDDESSDHSGEICDGMAKSEQRIKVIHQRNSGTSGARNTGLKATLGDYVLFMDNDDYWNGTDVLEQLDNQIRESQADVIMFDNCTYWETEKKMTYGNYQIKRADVLESGNPIMYVIESGQMSRAVWNKAVKRDLIFKNELWFKENIRNEDTEWTARLFQKAESYDWCEKVFYVYRKGHMGAQTSGRITYKMWTDLKNIIRKTVDDAQGLPEKGKQALLNYISYPYAVCMGQMELVQGVMEGDIQELKQYRFLLKISKDPYVKKIKICYRILGWRITAKLIALYMKKKYDI